MPTTLLKLLILGDGAVGKSCLLITYSHNSFPSEYVPTVFDNYDGMPIMVEGKPYQTALWDTGGQEDYDILRPLAYPGTDVFLVAFSVDNPDSLANVGERWFPEIRHHCPDVPAIVVGCKADLRAGAEDRNTRCVTVEEAEAAAQRWGAAYVETSALTHTGLTECFDLAVRTAVNGRVFRKRKSLSFRLGWKKSSKLLPIPPVMPRAGKAPLLEVEMSTFANDWYKVLQDPRFYDVTFVVENRQLNAHKIVLCSASKFFAKVFQLCVGSGTQQQRQMSAIDSFSDKDLNSGRLEGIASLHEERDGARALTTVVLSQDIRATTFVRVLEFLYTGLPHLPEKPRHVDELSRVAALFRLSHLVTICTNVKREEDFLNPSIGTFLNNEMGTAMKTLFFNQPEHADVIFNVQGSKVYAHRVVLSAHSAVMAAMFSGNFSEGDEQKTIEISIPDSPVDTFLALLEYLYTDHLNIEGRDSVGLLILADEYCMPRLCNLCELYITKEVNRRCSERILRSDIDVIGLLNTAETYNAKYLVKWCLHFISTNYLSFESREEFSQLQSGHKKFVTENRWPPVSYLKEVEEFEKKLAENYTDKKCVLM